MIVNRTTINMKGIQTMKMKTNNLTFNDAAILVTALQEGTNSHKDIDAMVAFFTDDAVASFPGQPPPNVLTGKEEIQAWQQSEFADNSHIECDNLKVSGDKATWTLKYLSDSLLKLDLVPPPLDSTSLLKNVNPYPIRIYIYQNALITSSKLWYSIIVNIFTTTLYQV